MDTQRPPAPAMASQRKPGGTSRCGPRRGSACLALITTLVVLTACGSPGTNSTDSGMGRTADPSQQAYSEYEKRCLTAMDRIDTAKVVFDPDITMKKDRSSTVTAVVTLNTAIPDEALLPDVHASAAPIGVTCDIQARLVANSGEFDRAAFNVAMHAARDSVATASGVVTATVDLVANIGRAVQVGKAASCRLACRAWSRRVPVRVQRLRP